MNTPMWKDGMSFEYRIKKLSSNLGSIPLYGSNDSGIKCKPRGGYGHNFSFWTYMGICILSYGVWNRLIRRNSIMKAFRKAIKKLFLKYGGLCTA